jgi:hypothetical protein
MIVSARNGQQFRAFRLAMKLSGLLTALTALSMLAACDSYPRDIVGARDRVVESGKLHVGFGPMPDDRRALADRFVSRVAGATGASVAATVEESDEALFAALDKGDLDLVLTEVAADSPWLTEVAVIEPLATRRVGKRELGLSAVARNGENRWVMVLERQVREMGRGS